jgi:hypothetical protein
VARQTKQGVQELRTKLLVAVGVLAICSAVALTGVAGARERAKTTVTIHYNGDGFQGKVKSPRAKCVRNRTVKVFKLKHGTRQKLYSDTTDQDGRWNTGNSGPISGRFYAHTGRVPGCKAGTSKTIHT